MITNFENNHLYIFFKDLLQIIKTVVYRLVKLFLANYNIIDSDTPTSTSTFDSEILYKPLEPEKEITEDSYDFINDVPEPKYGKPAKPHIGLMPYNTNEYNEFSYDIIKPKKTLEALNTISITQNFDRDNTDYKPKPECWEKSDHINRPWFVNQ